MLYLLLACSDDPLPAGAPTEGAFTALTYNVQGLPDILAEAERPGIERMERIGPLLDPFDWVGVQEDFDATNHEQLALGVTHETVTWFDDLVEPARVYGSGLATFSRLGETVEVFEEFYTDCFGVFDSSSDCLASKGFQVVRVRLGGAELDLYNTHHEAGGGEEDQAARRTQIEQVLASMDDRSSGRTVLFLGDTNLRPSDLEDVDELALYLDAGLRDACTELACAEADHIDRFLFRDGPDLTLTATGWSRETQFVDELGADLSDHPAIGATFSWATE